jgi:hypothetical protein
VTRQDKKRNGICYDCNQPVSNGKTRCVPHLRGNSVSVVKSVSLPSGQLHLQRRSAQYKPIAAEKRRHTRRTTERFSYAKQHAIARGLLWSLTQNEYFTLISNPCVNCNTPTDIECGVGLKMLNRRLGYVTGNVTSTCRGCQIRSTTASFIDRASRVHNSRYDYTLVQYQASESPVTILCKVHGPFQQVPHSHLKGHGCPLCGANVVKHHSVMAKTSIGTLYLVRMRSSTECFLKLGITTTSLKRRFHSKAYRQYEITVIHTINTFVKTLVDAEETAQLQYSHYRYRPNTSFGGYTECFKEEGLLSLCELMEDTYEDVVGPQWADEPEWDRECSDEC